MELAAAQERVAARERAAQDALAQFDQFWDLLAAHVSAVQPDVAHTHGQGAWLLTVGDRRLVVQIAEPADSRCGALQLGLVTVEGQDRDQRSNVANLCAIATRDGMPEWRTHTQNGPQ